MSSEEYIANLQRKLEELKEHNKPFETAIKTVMSQIPTRIFSKGIKSDGTPIGKYKDDYELYVPDDRLRKRGNHKGKTGKPITTSYYRNYSQLKKEMGFTQDYVNSRQTNQLQSDLSNTAIERTTKVAGAILPDKISAHEYHVTLKNTRNINVAKGMESRYGTIYQPTQEEIDLLYKTNAFELEIFMSS